jgi:hypothetical protein
MEGKLNTKQKKLYFITFFLYLLLFFFLYFFFAENNLQTSFEILAFSNLPSHLTRDEKGRFISKPQKNDKLPVIVKKAIIGELLGDGSLQSSKKDPDGKPKASANAYMGITLKSFEHITFLYEKIYKSICTSTGPKP